MFVLLKSTSPDGGLVPYKFGADIAKTYETQRDKVVTLTDPEHAYEKVVQLHLIDSVLKGYEIDDCIYVEFLDLIHHSGYAYQKKAFDYLGEFKFKLDI